MRGDFRVQRITLSRASEIEDDGFVPTFRKEDTSKFGMIQCWLNESILPCGLSSFSKIAVLRM
jgi:hypothetical protein